jgi:hypothetical protein
MEKSSLSNRHYLYSRVNSNPVSTKKPACITFNYIQGWIELIKLDGLKNLGIGIHFYQK